MALKPLRPCRHPGCPELTREGYCPAHKPAKAPRRSSAQWHGWYGLDVWRNDLRPTQLLREPFCRECAKAGRRTLATRVDHVESKEVSIRDIARYFGIPLYKLQEGKQAYGSNEQNAIEYVVGTLHPIVSQYEEEQTWKLLAKSQVDRGLELRINLMAELKGDTSARAEWYRTMVEIGGFSVNDILALEDKPDVPGGEHRRASLNFVPLADWAELSRIRAASRPIAE